MKMKTRQKLETLLQELRDAAYSQGVNHMSGNLSKEDRDKEYGDSKVDEIFKFLNTLNLS